MLRKVRTGLKSDFLYAPITFNLLPNTAYDVNDQNKHFIRNRVLVYPHGYKIHMVVKIKNQYIIRFVQTKQKFFSSDK